jgi:peptidoglycan/LPS O-acetylase OafA/YrhL
MAHTAFRKDIGGLRAIAVTLVILNHAKIPFFSGGFIGVDIFFVISGFLISGSLISEYMASANTSKDMLGKISILNFYQRRARRILPAALSALLLTSIFCKFFLPSGQFSQFTAALKSALFFYANIFFLNQGTDYFAQNQTSSILQHFWSLSVEEQFYFVWPLVFLLVINLHKIQFRKKYVRFYVRLLISVLLISLLSIVIQINLYLNDTSASYFSTFARAWELSFGAIVATVLAFRAKFTWKKLELFDRKPILYKNLSFTVLMFSLLFVSEVNFGFTLILPVMATGLFIYVGGISEKSSGTLNILLENKIVQYVGKISYSLYLWHWIIFSIIRISTGKLDLIWVFIGILLSLLLSSLSYHFIEKKFLKMKLIKIRVKEFEFTKKDRLVFTSTSLALVISILALATHPSISPVKIPQPINWEPPDNLAASKIQSVSEIPSSSQSESQTSSVQSTVDITAFKSSWDSSLAAAQQNDSIPEKYRNLMTAVYKTQNKYESSGCASWDLVITPKCILGDQNGVKTLALLGDSRATALAPAISQAALRAGIKVTMYSQFGCPFVPTSSDDKRTDAKRAQVCLDHRKWVVQELQSQQFGTVLISDISGQDVLDTKYYQELTKSIAALRKLTSKVIVVAPLPGKSIDLTSCFTSVNTIVRSCFSVSDLKYQENTSNKLSSILTKSGALEINLTKYVCSNGYCPPFIDGVPVTRDGSHYTPAFAEILWPFIFEYLRE